MFKKLKDKLAEEVKSSPQRIQQFAQAAQAAVTSASSSISDITNNDLFSIGDNDNQQSNSMKPKTRPQSHESSSFQNVSLEQATATPTPSSADLVEYSARPDSAMENQRQRRLSNSSFASDVSFRLPSYESPSMYHLQSDMDVSASEAEERGFSSSTVSLDRVTKEQLYSAYRRTQERYTKYRTQYADLARHYKLLERENAKARSVLVETQDKALRRISELREQCSLEQSAKAHLEKALRVEIDEGNLKIQALETKVKLLCDNKEVNENNDNVQTISSDDNENNENLITLTDSGKDQTIPIPSDLQAVNGKIEKLEQLLNKYKESLKATKEKNSHMTTQLQIVTKELEEKRNEIESMTEIHLQLDDKHKQEIQQLTESNEELNNKVKTYDFAEIKEVSILKLDLQKAQEKIAELQSKIEIFTKREEENAISLAENKLSIHKELESKESEIKSLKHSLATSKKEIQSLNIVVTDYKATISSLEAEKNTLNNNLNEYNSAKSKLIDLEAYVQDLSEKCKSLEDFKIKISEEYKCLQLQMKQETAEKLAIKDRNGYLENRNQQLLEENSMKTTEINNLELEIKSLKESLDDSGKDRLIEEINSWKLKYESKNTEIQEEREELVKLQSEIEKLLANHELLQDHNLQLNEVITQLKHKQNEMLQKAEHSKEVNKNIIIACKKLLNELSDLKEVGQMTTVDLNTLKKEHLELSNNVLNRLNAIAEQCAEKVNNRDKWESMYEKIFNEKKIVEEELRDVNIKYKNTSEEANNLRQQVKNLNDHMQKIEQESVDMQTKLKKLDDLILENCNLQENFNKHKLAHDNLQSSSDEISIQLSNVLGETEKYKQENEQLQKTVKDLDNTNTLLEGNLNNVKQELESTKNSVLLLDNTNQTLTEENFNLKSQYEYITQSFESLQTEVNMLRDSHIELVSEKDRLNSVISSLENNVKVEMENKQSQTDKTQTIEQLNKSINLLEKQLDTLKDKNESFKDDNEKLKVSNKELSHTINNLTNELSSIKRDDEISKAEIVSLNNIISDLTQKLETVNNKFADVDTKQVELGNENIILSNINEELTKKYNDINEELILLKNKFSQITEDKSNVQSKNVNLSNDLNSMSSELEKLKSKNNEFEQENNLFNSKNSQLTKEINTLNDQLESLRDKIKVIEETNIALTDNNLDLSRKLENELQNNVLNDDYDLIKDENRRLKSDIGLQSYLTKISKENGQLNDKLREMIATSEHGLAKGDADELSILNNQSQSLDEKIAELTRENMLLVEENLELKDQIHSQNGASIINCENNTEIEKKCSTLETSKKSLEHKLDEIEQLNKILNINVEQTQQNNEKLRHTNEKLETRLDEALVSLRHLHALQENTELEYLRNILYEYFTGAGNHSLTLAKVIAAVVKFDDSQTKTILSKEKERQGFLRQLGLL